MSVFICHFTWSASLKNICVRNFGGALNLNVHFHSLYTDGVFHENDQGDEVFEEIIPSHEDVVKLLKKHLLQPPEIINLKAIGRNPYA
jgi:hypothetical protein